MNKSESIGKLAKALSLAQAEMKGATKDATNPFFKSSYADLQSVCEAIKDSFAKYGLSYAQPMGFNDQGAAVVETILMHESNEWLSGETLILAKDSSAQAQGSGISYARRYALASIVGLYQTDDDAESAQPRKPPMHTPMAQLLTQPPKPIVDPLAAGGTFGEHAQPTRQMPTYNKAPAKTQSIAGGSFKDDYSGIMDVPMQAKQALDAFKGATSKPTHPKTASMKATVSTKQEQFLDKVRKENGWSDKDFLNLLKEFPYQVGSLKDLQWTKFDSLMTTLKARGR